jgi:protein SCO1
VPVRIIFIVLGVGLLIAITAFALQYRGPGTPVTPVTPVTLEAGTLVAQSRSVPEFSLLDQRRRQFTRTSLAGRWTLLFTGFTHCPDICPATLATLADVDERLRAAGVRLQVVFLSLDPERDDPATMADYVSHFSPHLVGATGERAEIDRLMAGLGLAYVKVPASEGHYTIDHSTALALVNPRGRVAAYFQQPLDPDLLVSDLAALIRPAR